MVEEGNILEWDNFVDDLYWPDFLNNGIAILERRYTLKGNNVRRHWKSDENDYPSPYVIVAKGISAYLSPNVRSNITSLRHLINNNEERDIHAIFKKYFEYCFKFLDAENSKITFPENRSSEKELIEDHLEIEKQYLLCSDFLYKEMGIREKATMEEIRKVATYYLQWITDNYLQTTIKPFSQYFRTDNQYIPEICKRIFDNNSPKEYAIMFCLLCDKEYLAIPNRGRKIYYEAWYTYINKEFPKNNNYFSINQFIADKANNGLYFKDETDSDYGNLNQIFTREIERYNSLQ